MLPPAGIEPLLPTLTAVKLEIRPWRENPNLRENPRTLINPRSQRMPHIESPAGFFYFNERVITGIGICTGIGNLSWLSCFSEMGIVVGKTVHSTDSSQLGVVRDPYTRILCFITGF